ncbi:hypothetical protein Pfo_030816 [Paulownia fortunei]|nr:hypothetical protein Pfo_030816 [Paulownia fortunei]
MADPANHPDNMTHATTLSEINLANLRKNAGIPEEFNVVLPGPRDRPHAPHPGYVTFFIDQLEAGLRFPIPDLFCCISKSFGILLMQLVPNSFRLMVDFWMVVSYFRLILFHFRGAAKFLTLKDWKKKYFYISSPDLWNFPTNWITDLPYQGRVPALDSAAQALARRLNHSPYNPEGQSRVPLTSAPLDYQPVPATRAPSVVPPPSLSAFPPAAAAALTSSRSRGKCPASASGDSSGPSQRPCLNAPISLNASFFTSSSERITVVERDRTTLENQILKATEEASISRAEGHAAGVLAGRAE